MTLECGVNVPCSAQQLKEMASVGARVTDAVSTFARDAGLPNYASQMGIAALASVVGSVEGAVEKEIGGWKFLSTTQFAVAQDICSQMLHVIVGGLGDATAGETFGALAHTLVSIGGSVAKEVAKDVANVVPIAGAVISVVIDLIAALVDALKKPNAYETAVAAEVERHRFCVEQVLGPSPVVPTGEDGRTLPCDLFNGAPYGFSSMPAVGLGLIAATEANGLVRADVRSALAGLRLAIQGSWLNPGSTRGYDPVTGKPVPPTPGSSDGGASLWPIYMDAVLRQRQLGNLADDVILESLVPYTQCPAESVPAVVGLIADWKLRKQRADTGTGYAQWRSGNPMGKLTASQTTAVYAGSAVYAGKLAGVSYSVTSAPGGFALVSPKSTITFGAGLSPTLAGRRSPPAALVVGLAAGAAYGSYWLAKRYLLR